MEALYQHKCNVCIIIETLRPKCLTDIIIIPQVAACYAGRVKVFSSDS